VETPGLRFTVHEVDGARIVAVDVEIKPRPVEGEVAPVPADDGDDAEDGVGTRT
jgi:hypothetical protein